MGAGGGAAGSPGPGLPSACHAGGEALTMPCTLSHPVCREGRARHKGQAVQASEAAAEKGGGGGAAPGRAPPAPGGGACLGAGPAPCLDTSRPWACQRIGKAVARRGLDAAGGCSLLTAARPLPPQGDAAPANAQEFEALLLSSPNSSFVWIKYMAFLISLGDVDRARAVAQRALDTINYRCAVFFLPATRGLGGEGGEGAVAVTPVPPWADGRQPSRPRPPAPREQGGRRAVQRVGGAAQPGEQLRQRGGHAERAGAGAAARRRAARVPGRHRRVPPLPQAGAAGAVLAGNDQEVWRCH